MKKLLYSLTSIFALLIGAQVLGAAPAYADGNNVTLLNQNNFQSTLNTTGSYQLTENVTISDWQWAPTQVFSGTLDGNGYSLTLNRNLFYLMNNATIKNIKIVLSGDFTFDDTSYSYSNITGSSNFGIIAQQASASQFINTIVTGQATVKVKSSVSVGAFVGNATNGTIIKNCYSSARMTLEQTSSSALNTTLGGLVGTLEDGIITNSYFYNNAPVALGVNVTAESAVTEVYLGGLIGQAVKTSQSVISNAFCGGAMNVTYNNSNKIFAGKISGLISGYNSANLCNVYSFNQQSYEFFGKMVGAIYSDIAQKNSALFTATTNFVDGYVDTETNRSLWNILYPWDTASTWCKTTEYNFISLQIFESFSVTVNDLPNDEIEYEIYIAENGDYVPTDLSVFKYGTNLRITASVTEEFSDYKVISSLQKNNTNQDLNIQLNNEKTLASYDFMVNGFNEGAYFAITNDIEFTIKVQTQDKNFGQVKYGSNDSVLRPLIQYTMVYGGQYTFTAMTVSSSYAFDKWVWIDENAGEEAEPLDAIRGNNELIKADRTTINIAFGQDGTNNLMTYLTLDNNIPYVEDGDGNKTFTIQANFTDNKTDLTIMCNYETAVCDVYVNGELQTSTTPGILCQYSVQIGKEYEIIIVARDGYQFDKWVAAAGLNFNSIINAEKGDEATATTLHLTLSKAFTITANIEVQVENNFDMNIVWYSLGGVGGAAVIALIIILIVKRSKRDDFMNYY